MAFYTEKAARYRDLCTDLMALLPEEHRAKGAEIAARLVNAGVVACPRGVQGTVRLRIVQAVTADLPIRCRLVETPVNPEDPNSRTYNALHVEPKRAS